MSGAAASHFFRSPAEVGLFSIGESVESKSVHQQLTQRNMFGAKPITSCLLTERRVTALLQTLLQDSLNRWNYWRFSCFPLFPVAVGNRTRLSLRLVLWGSRAGTWFARNGRRLLSLLHWALGSQVLVESTQNLLLVILLPEEKTH